MDNYVWVEYVSAFTSFFKHRIYPMLSPTLLPSVHIPLKHKGEVLRANTVDEAGNCKFCLLAHSQEVLYSDSTIAVLEDINPKCRRHLLVIPTKHYDNIYALGISELELVSHMYEVGARMLCEEAPEGERRFGFHVPPRASVNHLHLHCMALPFRNCWSRLSFSNSLWLMSPEDTLRSIAES